MIRVAALLLVLTAPAAANPLQQATDWAHCFLYPSHARCKPPQPTPEPALVPIPAPRPPEIMPPPTAPVATPAPPRAAPKAKPRPKPKYKAAPVRKRLAAGKLAAWCARVPKGTTMGQIEFAAPLWGVKLTAANRAQARACLASKGT